MSVRLDESIASGGCPSTPTINPPARVRSTQHPGRGTAVDDQLDASCVGRGLAHNPAHDTAGAITAMSA